VQSSWHLSVTSCARPPTDYGTPIICYTDRTLLPLSPAEGFLFSHGGDFDLLAKCCPKISNGTNIYKTELNCPGEQYCFTYDSQLAGNWKSCVEETAKARLDTMKRAGAVWDNATYSGKCERIDYETLRAGVPRSAATTMRLTGLGVWSALLGSLAVIGVVQMAL
jgi:hypothetical protein